MTGSPDLAPDLPAGLARRARFSRWDGSQRLADLDANEIMRALAEDVMAEGDLGEALRRLLERGWRSDDPTRPGLPGLRDLMDGLARRRQELRERYGLADVLGDMRRELAEIAEQERAGVEQRLERSATGDAPEPELAGMLRDLASRRLDQLEALPDDVGERIRSLREYDFLDPDARRRFDDLVERLGRQVLDQFAQGLGDAIRSTSPEDLAASREMVRDLDELLRERIAGGEPDVRDFLARHGRSSPGAPSLDDIIDQLARRMAAMRSLMRSMTPEQRAELESMMDALLRDDRLRADLARLASSLDLLLPGGAGDRVRFTRDESLSLDGALQQIARLQAMERLEQVLTVLGAAPVEADQDELSRLGSCSSLTVPTRRRAPCGWWPRTTSAPSRVTNTGTCSALARQCSRRGTPIATASSTSAGG